MRIGLAAVALVVLVSCGRAGDMTRDDKLSRIDEMYTDYQAEFPEVEDISLEELFEALDSDGPPILVDVRTAAERRVSTIPGAISQREFESLRSDLGARAVVTYCTIGYRSGLYADELRRQGLDVRNFKGSILAWTHGGRPLHSDGREIRRVHVYGPRWNLAADDFEAIW